MPDTIERSAEVDDLAREGDLCDRPNPRKRAVTIIVDSVLSQRSDRPVAVLVLRDDAEQRMGVFEVGYSDGEAEKACKFLDLMKEGAGGGDAQSVLWILAYGAGAAFADGVDVDRDSLLGYATALFVHLDADSVVLQLSDGKDEVNVSSAKVGSAEAAWAHVQPMVDEFRLRNGSVLVFEAKVTGVN